MILEPPKLLGVKRYGEAVCAQAMARHPSFWLERIVDQHRKRTTGVETAKGGSRNGR
jgi:hypothetical protein